MKIGARISELRIAKNLTINKLAYNSGVAQSYLRDLELEIKDNPSINVIENICFALNISLSDFFNTEQPTPPVNRNLLNTISKMTPEQQNILETFLSSFQASNHSE